MAGVSKAGGGRLARAAQDRFLDGLGETSNVAASARAAGLTPGAVYRERRRNKAFAERWHAALCEGYARLETELLAEALVAASGNVKDTTLKARAQKYRLGLTLLAAHRAAVRGNGAGPGTATVRRTGARARLKAKMLAMHERLAGAGDAGDTGDAGHGAGSGSGGAG